MAEAYAASDVTDAVKCFIASDRCRATHLIVVQRLSGSDRFFVVGGNDGFGGNGSVGRNEDVVDESAVPVNRLLADEIKLFFSPALTKEANRTVWIRQQCRKTTVLSCHRCLINTGVKKNELHLNIDNNFDHQMSL